MDRQDKEELYNYLTLADPLYSGIKVYYKRENFVRTKEVHFNRNMGTILRILGIKYNRAEFNEYSQRLNLGWTAYKGGVFKEVRTK